MGGAGYPPAEDKKFIMDVILKMERNLCRERPYRRAMLFGLPENGGVSRMLKSDELKGEASGKLDSSMLKRFRHQLEIFREERPSCDVEITGIQTLSSSIVIWSKISTDKSSRRPKMSKLVLCCGQTTALVSLIS